MSDVCEGCRGLGGNWTCDGENEGRNFPCPCENCTGNEDCSECGGTGEYA